MRLQYRLAAIAFLTATLCSAAVAQTSVQFNPSATEVHYKVGSLLHTVHGTFLLAKGSLQFNPMTGQASGEIDIDAASGDSGNGSRDKKMTKEILEAQKYPLISFQPREFVGTIASSGDSNIQVKGLFRIHGKDHAMTLPVTVTPVAGGYKVNTKFEVPYVAWGMKNPSTFVLTVEKTVEITIETRAALAAPATASR